MKNAKKPWKGSCSIFPASSIQKIELLQKDAKFVFSLRDSVWYLEQPLAAKADKVALESILDNFCPLKYDRLVTESAGGDLKNFGLSKPEIELRLFAKDSTRPAHTILLGKKNNLDSSSYAKLAAGGKVVSIAAYKRENLEKDLFAFRDKRFFELDNLAVIGMSYQYDSGRFSFYKKDERWFMEKPLFSLAQEAKVSDILSAASMLEAKSFAGTISSASSREFGLEKPLLTVEFRSAAGSKKSRSPNWASAFTPWLKAAGKFAKSERISRTNSAATPCPSGKGKLPCSILLTSASSNSSTVRSLLKFAKVATTAGSSSARPPGKSRAKKKSTFCSLL